jgi:hypothetical protein
MTHGTPSVSWWGATTPTLQNTGTATQWVGQKIKFTTAGRIFGFRLYKDASYNGNTHGLIWNASTFQIYRAFNFRIANFSGTGWLQTWIHPTIRIDTAISYDVVVLIPNGKYWSTVGALSAPVTHNNINFLSGIDNTNINIATTDPAARTDAYGVDVLFQPG